MIKPATLILLLLAAAPAWAQPHGPSQILECAAFLAEELRGQRVDVHGLINHEPSSLLEAATLAKPVVVALQEYVDRWNADAAARGVATLIPMREGYVLAEYRQILSRIHGQAAADRLRESLVTVAPDGSLLRGGKPLSTRDWMIIRDLERTVPTGLYVADGYRNLYIFQYGELPYGRNTHTYASMGMPVSAGGTIDAPEGVIERMDNGSGHYWPPFSATVALGGWLKERGANMESAELQNHDEQWPGFADDSRR